MVNHPRDPADEGADERRRRIERLVAEHRDDPGALAALCDRIVSARYVPDALVNAVAGRDGRRRADGTTRG